MDEMLVIVFDSEIKAYEGTKALQELQQEGSIKLLAKAVIARDTNGKVEVRQIEDISPSGTAVGLLTGSLIGLIAGPVGVAIGASAGTLGGLTYDLADMGVEQDFLIEAEKSLQPGKAAVVAEVIEDWTLPLDNRMESLGGVVLRRTREDVVSAQNERDIAKLNADLDKLEAENKKATDEAKAKLDKQVDEARSRLQAALDSNQARVEARQKEIEARINSLKEQAGSARQTQSQAR